MVDVDEVGRARKLSLRRWARRGAGLRWEFRILLLGGWAYAFLSDGEFLHPLAQGLGFGGQLAHGQVDTFHYLQILSRYIGN